jgi:hypothetical protein
LTGFTDLDWGSDIDDRKSTGGYIFQLGSNPITWSSKKQATTSLSSCEAEYRAAKEAGKEVIWLRHLLCELGFQQISATTLYCDNQSAIQVASNPVFHAKTKHIEIDVHYIRDLVQENIVNLQFCPSEDQTTDIFTKSMLEAKFLKLRSMIV